MSDTDKSVSSNSSHTVTVTNSSGTFSVTSPQTFSDSHTSLATPHIAASASLQEGSHLTGTIVALTLIFAALAAVIVFGYFYLKRKRKLSTLVCWRSKSHSHSSSISGSRRALAELDDMEISARSRQPGDNTDEMFTIEDFDDPADNQDGRQEYFYDEVFGQSQFEDETTNNAMRYLYNDNSELTQEEMLNMDDVIQGIQFSDSKKP